MLSPKKGRTRFIKPTLPKDKEVGFLKNEEVAARHFGATLGLFNPGNKNILMLNPTAALIWNNIEPKRSVSKLVELIELSHADDRDGEEILMEVSHTLKRFEEEGLIEETKLKDPDKTEIAITEFSMVQLPNAFERPSIQTYSLEQIQKVSVGNSVFCDTWNGELP